MSTTSFHLVGDDGFIEIQINTEDSGCDVSLVTQEGRFYTHIGISGLVYSLLTWLKNGNDDTNWYDLAGFKVMWLAPGRNFNRLQGSTGEQTRFLLCSDLKPQILGKLAVSPSTAGEWYKKLEEVRTELQLLPQFARPLAPPLWQNCWLHLKDSYDYLGRAIKQTLPMLRWGYYCDNHASSPFLSTASYHNYERLSQGLVVVSAGAHFEHPLKEHILISSDVWWEDPVGVDHLSRLGPEVRISTKLPRRANTQEISELLSQEKAGAEINAAFSEIRHFILSLTEPMIEALQ